MVMDLGILAAMIIATFGVFIVYFYSREEVKAGTKTGRTMKIMTRILFCALVFEWASFAVIWL